MKRRRFKKRIKVENADAPEHDDELGEEELELDEQAEVNDSEDGEQREAASADGPGEEQSDAGSADQTVDNSRLDQLADELEVIRDEAQRYQQEARENYDKFLRAVAEMENVKKRSKKERSDLLRYAGEGMARELLEVVDSLELALKQRAAEAEPNEFSRGIEMIRDQFVSTFERFGIKGESALGKKFDPELHEAMVSVPTDEHPAGTVIEEYKKTYRFRDKLLRAGQVVVATAPEVEEKADGDQGGASAETEAPEAG